MRKTFQNLALQQGFTLAGASQEADVAELIKRLQPIEPSRPLVRLGGDSDGGYLVPDVLDEIGICFSPGVNDQIDLELDLAGRGIRSYLADYSVAGLPQQHDLLTFDPYFIDAYTDGNRICIDDWVNGKLDGSERNDLLLQMDIEGNEYAALLATSTATLQRFQLLVLEFHNLHKLFDPVGLMLFRSCFDKLLLHFDVVHIHPNNFLDIHRMGEVEIPRCMEFTFERRVSGRSRKPVTRFPHALDRECVPTKPALPLPQCWYSATP